MRYLQTVFGKIKAQSPFLYYIVLIHIGCIIPILLGLMIDDRVLMGVNVWIKPLKFAISQIIYITTVGLLVTLYPYSDRKKKIINNTVAITLLTEFAIILIQASRGVKSHYNTDTPLDGILFAIMGLFVGVNVIIMLVFIIDTIRKKMKTAKVIQWSILLGWLIVLFGSWFGSQMIGQMSHSVNIPDGGEGLPLLNWSTIAGDLRVAHFFGLHGIQVIPLMALLITHKWKSSHRNHVIAVTLLALCYAAWIGHTYYQAKQGIPLITR